MYTEMREDGHQIPMKVKKVGLSEFVNAKLKVKDISSDGILTDANGNRWQLVKEGESGGGSGGSTDTGALAITITDITKALYPTAESDGGILNIDITGGGSKTVKYQITNNGVAGEAKTYTTGALSAYKTIGNNQVITAWTEVNGVKGNEISRTFSVDKVAYKHKYDLNLDLSDAQMVLKTSAGVEITEIPAAGDTTNGYTVYVKGVRQNYITKYVNTDDLTDIKTLSEDEIGVEQVYCYSDNGCITDGHNNLKVKPNTGLTSVEHLVDCVVKGYNASGVRKSGAGYDFAQTIGAESQSARTVKQKGLSAMIAPSIAITNITGDKYGETEYAGRVKDDNGNYRNCINQIALTTEYTGATLYYKLWQGDTEPTDWTAYTGKLIVRTAGTWNVKAKVESGNSTSDIASATTTIKVVELKREYSLKSATLSYPVVPSGGGTVSPALSYVQLLQVWTTEKDSVTNTIITTGATGIEYSEGTEEDEKHTGSFKNLDPGTGALTVSEYVDSTSVVTIYVKFVLNDIEYDRAAFEEVIQAKPDEVVPPNIIVTDVTATEYPDAQGDNGVMKVTLSVVGDSEQIKYCVSTDGGKTYGPNNVYKEPFKLATAGNCKVQAWNIVGEKISDYNYYAFTVNKVLYKELWLAPDVTGASFKIGNLTGTEIPASGNTDGYAVLVSGVKQTKNKYYVAAETSEAEANPEQEVVELGNLYAAELVCESSNGCVIENGYLLKVQPNYTTSKVSHRLSCMVYGNDNMSAAFSKKISQEAATALNAPTIILNNLTNTLYGDTYPDVVGKNCVNQIQLQTGYDNATLYYKAWQGDTEPTDWTAYDDTYANRPIIRTEGTWYIKSKAVVGALSAEMTTALETKIECVTLATIYDKPIINGLTVTAIPYKGCTDLQLVGAMTYSQAWRILKTDSDSAYEQGAITTGGTAKYVLNEVQAGRSITINASTGAVTADEYSGSSTSGTDVVASGELTITLNGKTSKSKELSFTQYTSSGVDAPTITVTDVTKTLYPTAVSDGGIKKITFKDYSPDATIKYKINNNGNEGEEQTYTACALDEYKTIGNNQVITAWAEVDGEKSKEVTESIGDIAVVAYQVDQAQGINLACMWSGYTWAYKRKAYSTTTDDIPKDLLIPAAGGELAWVIDDDVVAFPGDNNKCTQIFVTKYVNASDATKKVYLKQADLIRMSTTLCGGIAKTTTESNRVDIPENTTGVQRKITFILQAYTKYSGDSKVGFGTFDIYQAAE